ncbi:DsbA family protein [Candidatus Micrarchaeota archaeon]|nr:DsbA family protein [Candidatus Micrarchaeota archaeon]MBU1939488.1 DsbA family protein [Candidatus Micrarchaeota archaeon]
MEKHTLISILVGVTLLLTFINTYTIFGIGQQLDSMQGAIVLVGSGAGSAGTGGAGSGAIKAAAPLPSQGTAPAAAAAPKQNVSADDDAVLGNANAPVEIIEFSDYECPFCSRFVTQTLPEIKTKYIDTGKVKLIYRDFPLEFHADAQKAAEAAECAEEQGKYYEMHDAIFENQQAIGVSSLKAYAAQIGLDTAKFDACLDTGAMAAEVKKDAADGSAAGVSGTPTFFINGTKIVGAQSFSAFESAIEIELAKAGS